MEVSPSVLTKLAELCERYHVARLAMFGSQNDGSAREDSDLDLLITFKPGHAPGFLRLAEMAEQFSALFGGLTVDLRTSADLSPILREEVESAARVLYAA